MLKRTWLVCVLLLTACGDSGSGPWLAFAGGGFAFDYAYGNAFYGVVVRPLRRIPTGTILEAQFEDPAGGAVIVVRQTVQKEQIYYTFKSPPVLKIQKDRPYRVQIRVLAADGTSELGRYEQMFKSDVDQDMVAKRP